MRLSITQKVSDPASHCQRSVRSITHVLVILSLLGLSAEAMGDDKPVAQVEATAEKKAEKKKAEKKKAEKKKAEKKKAEKKKAEKKKAEKKKAEKKKAEKKKAEKKKAEKKKAEKKKAEKKKAEKKKAEKKKAEKKKAEKKKAEKKKAEKKKAAKKKAEKKRPAKKASTKRSETSPAITSKGKTSSKKTFQVSGALLTQLHLRNDNDFDPTERYDDLDGQSDGQLATFFSPTFTIRPGDGVTVRYRLELGWNAWSRNDPGQPNQFFSMRTPGLLARHKLAWAQWKGDGVRLRAGFQQMSDPTGLFLNHAIGAVTTRLNLGARHKRAQHLTLMVGQLPDTTIEGLDIRNDNFMTDTFIMGARHRGIVNAQLHIDTGAYYLIDRRALERPLDLGVLSMHLEWTQDDLEIWADVSGQYGEWGNSTVGGGDATIGSWATQVGLTKRVGKVSWGLNLLGVSGDDDHDGNDVMGAFFGSAKNRSRSVFLTEDETRDRYDNLDERLGSYWGPLAYSPAGLMLGEVSMGLKAHKQYHARLVLATGAVMNPTRVFGQRYVGAEVSILQTFKLSDRASLTLNGLLFVPGGAAAVMINDIKRSARQGLYGGSAGFVARF